MSVHKIATSTLWQLVSQVVMAVFSIFIVKFIAIGLTKELAGHYNSAYGYLQLFAIFADFGLYAVAIREISRAKNRSEILGTFLTLRMMAICIAFGSALVFVWSVPQWRGTPFPLGVSIAAFVPIFTLLAGTLRAIFQVHYRMHLVFIAEVAQRIFTATVIGIIILLLGSKPSGDVNVYYAVLLVGSIGGGILYLLSAIIARSLGRVRFIWNPQLLRQIAVKSAPYGVAFLCMAFYRHLDVTLIALWRSDFAVQNAYYGFVLRMVDMGYIMPTLLMNSTLPILSEQHAKGVSSEKLLGRVLLALLTLGSISLLFSLLWARPIIELLTTDAYLSTPERAGSDTALQLMAVPIFLNGLIAYSFYVLLTCHYWRRLVSTLLIGAIAALASNAILIPAYGFVGAAITSIGVHVLLALLLFPQALLAMRIRLPILLLVRWMVFSLLLAGSLWLLRPLLTGVAATAISLVIMGGVTAMFLVGCGLLKRNIGSAAI